MQEQEIDSDVMYGIAKKFNREMEGFPMHTHSAIVEMVRVGMQHRNLKMQKEDKDEADAHHERMLAVQEQQTKLATEEMNRRRALEMQPHLVPHPPDKPAEEVEEVEEPIVQ